MSTPVLDIGCPLTSASPEHQDLFATAYHRGVVKRLASKVEADPLAARLYERLLQLQGAVPIGAACWQPEIGAVSQRVDEDDVRAAVVTALFATHALRAGGRWETRLERPAWFSAGGHVFALSGAFGVEASADEIAIDAEAATGAPFVLRFTADGWRLAGDVPHPAFCYSAPQFVERDGFRDVYVHEWDEPKDGGTDMIVNWPIPRREHPTGIAAVAARGLAEGLDVLAQAGTPYLRWVRPLLRGVAATPLTYDDMRQSGSYTKHPGVFNCGFPGGAESIAEVIVHEVSHQNYLLLNAVYPLAADHDGERFYSSLKGADRPLSRVLLAYHAAANMALFWDDLAKRIELDEYYLAEREEMNRHVASLTAELNRARGLTEAGEILFRAQDELLRERGAVAC